MNPKAVRLNVILIVILFGTLHAFGQTAPIPDVTTSYETVKAGEGIWAFIAPEPKSALVSGNCVAIIGDDGVLVVDTGMIPSLTRRMIGEIRSKTDKPVRYVVNTHWHWDHNLGNFVYRDEFPGVTIISTAFTRQAMTEYSAKMLDLYQTKGAAFILGLRNQLESGTNPDGSPMSAEQKEAQTVLLHDTEAGVPEIQKGRIELPNQTFGETLTIYLGKREVDIRFLGRANTAGDAVVYVPDAKVLMTGDLLVGPIPFATGAYVPEWINAMKKLDSIDATVIVPGHGPVERDKSHLHAITALLESVLVQVQQGVQQDLPLEEIRKKVDIAADRDRLTAGIASRRRNFHDYFELPVVETIYKQLKGMPSSESPFQ